MARATSTGRSGCSTTSGSSRRSVSTRPPITRSASFLYALTTIGVWALIRALLGSASALIGAVAFAVYPRHGESVSWISGNTDVHATALLLPAVLVLLTRWSLWVRLALAFALGGFAALSKESIYALPALAAIVVWAARDDPSLSGARRYLAGMREAALAAAVTLAAVLPIFFARQSVIGRAEATKTSPTARAASSRRSARRSSPR